MTQPDKELPRVEVTRPFGMGSGFAMLTFMQVCAADDATDEEILEVCNRENPAGTENGWSAVMRADSDFWGKTAPVACDDHPGRTHFLVSC